MKLSYDKRIGQYIVTQWNPVTKRIELVDSDIDFNALGTRQGLLSDDEPEEFDPYAAYAAYEAEEE